MTSNLQSSQHDICENHDDVSETSEYDDQNERNNVDKDEKEELAKRESTAVWYMRLILVVVLICAALVVSLSVFFYLSEDEKDDFETQFFSDANKIIEGIGKSFDQTLGAVDAYLSTMVAQTHMLKTKFPFATVPGFGVQAAKLLKLSKAYQFGTVYFVKPEERDAWQKYASENNEWVNDTVDVQIKDNFWGPTLTNWQPNYEIMGFINNGTDYGVLDAPVNGHDDYAVSWQVAPLIEGVYSIPYNHDQWQSEAAPDIMECVKSKKVVIAKSPNVLMDPNDSEKAAYIKDIADYIQLYIPPDQDATEPLTAMTYPIIDSLDSVRINPYEDHEVVGILFFSLFWRDIIKGILPSNSMGLVVVFEASCGEVFTYQLDGPEAIYLGGGDLHDTKYDHLEVSASFGDILETAKEDRGSSYTGLPVNQDYCSRTARIYPSHVTEDQHTTNNPAVMASIGALIFIFTSLLFILYDWLVARRQRIVNDRAVASSAIVNSLFPKTVAKQLYMEQEEKPQAETNIKSFLHDASISDASARNSKPIADLYPDVTILFADLAGFTKWSSRHSPEDVFVMLETFYGKFDAIAKRKGIFKVETIGDCYVAVSGIPDPREDHAVAMSKFARDCMVEMNNIKVELAQTLGDDTLDLQFRVGLHSGSVIAGVLRGEKGRFQLFGDTMNTASRMESNGIPGKIQISQETADELKARGKDHWIVPREDKIQAKGKGELQTYFLQFKDAKSSYSRAMSTNSSSPSEGEKDIDKTLGLGSFVDHRTLVSQSLEQSLAKM